MGNAGKPSSFANSLRISVGITAALAVIVGCGSELTPDESRILDGDPLKGGVRSCRTINDTSCCGNSSCEGRETCENCAADCACGEPVTQCGDGSCAADESCATCPADCGGCPVPCGDGSCAADESCATCPADCGTCPLPCGDGTCGADEDCASCASDCGPCAPPATYTSPVMEPVLVDGTNFVLTWSLPATALGQPLGGFDIFTDGVDDDRHTTALSATLAGLAPSVEHCFKVEARWTQLVPAVFAPSNPVCGTIAATPPPPAAGPVLAFPGAEGFGAITTAGRGGAIVKVTNLNDSGTGSLRQALYYTPGKRIVVFEVAGIINLTSTLVIREPFVTIAGQTAPAPGITLSGYGMRIHTHDVLVQHLFFRAKTTLVDQDCLSIQPSGSDVPYNIVVDHCSMAWANDENLAIFPGYTDTTDQNITVSNCVIGEGHYGVLIGTNATRVSFLRNVVLSTVERQPRLGGNTYAQVVNNLLYNVGGYEFSAIGSSYGPDQVTYAGNSFVSGPSSRSGAPGIGTSSIQPGSKVYAPSSGLHASTATNNLTSSGITSYLVSVPPVPLDGIPVTPVASIATTLAATAGARCGERGTTQGDSVDERFFAEIQARAGSVKDRVQPTWTDPPVSGSRALDALLPVHPNADDDGNGYTNIEEVLFQMALQVEGR